MVALDGPASTMSPHRWCAGSGRGATSGWCKSRWPTAPPGWALALTSLRDFYASGGSPEVAGADFGAEARALGTMTARMHLALDGAFQREHEPVSQWVDEAEAVIAAADASLLEAPGVTDLVKWLRESEARLPVIRTHGDFQLGRTARTDQGWVVSDCAPGGVVAPASTVRHAHPAGRRGRPVVVDAPRQCGGGSRA